MGLEQSKDGGGQGSPVDCMTCATTASDDLTGCFVSRRTAHARHETVARDTLHTPRYHGAQGIVTVSPPTQAEHNQHRPSYIPEYNMEGEAPLASSNHWNSVNGPPSARDISSSQYSRPRVPSATFVGHHNEAKIVFPPQQTPGETASMITPRRLVSATNTPRSHADNHQAHPPPINPRAQFSAAGNAMEQYSQLGARPKPAGGVVPAGPSDAADGHAGIVGEGSSLGTTGSSSQMTTLADGPSVAAINSTPGNSMSLNLGGIPQRDAPNSGVQTPVTPDHPLSSRRSESPRQYVATKGGWIQTSVTISDMNIANWSQQKQDMFIEAVSATAQVPLSDVCVLSLKEKCGRRLLSIATEITFQVKAQSRDHATDIVRELKSQALDAMTTHQIFRHKLRLSSSHMNSLQTLDAMMMQANIRIRPDTARTVEDSALLNPRAEVNSGPFNTPFRNGYSLSSSYKSQFGGDTIESIAERTSPVTIPPSQGVPPDVVAVAEAMATATRTPSATHTPREPPAPAAAVAAVAAAPAPAPTTERKAQGTMLL